MNDIKDKNINQSSQKEDSSSNNPGTILTREEFDFIIFMLNNRSSNPNLVDRINSCIQKTLKGEKIGIGIPKGLSDNLDSIRKQHNPAFTADFLSLFVNPDGLKFLTHDFDPDSGMTMNDVAKQASDILNSIQYRTVKGSLRKLLDGFINGPEWIDYLNDKHSTFLRSNEIKTWCETHPALHPKLSNEFGEEIQMFRNTVRVSNPNLPKILDTIVKRNHSLQSLRIKKSKKLDKADFYTNVMVFAQYIIKSVLNDIAQREATANVTVSLERSSWDSYRLYSIRITHIGSEASPFRDVRNKIIAGGGALFNLLKSCSGYCDWTVEANFEGEFKRWRILNFQNFPEIEDLEPNSTEGFTHIFTFYKTIKNNYDRYNSY